mgnify:CR=1 FL=1
MKSEMKSEKIVNITPLKQLAIERLPKDSTLREVLLCEPDEMTATEYLIKIPTWQKLLKIEVSKNH